MKKLNYDEIFDIVKNNFGDVENLSLVGEDFYSFQIGDPKYTPSPEAEKELQELNENLIKYNQLVQEAEASGIRDFRSLPEIKSLSDKVFKRPESKIKMEDWIKSLGLGSIKQVDQSFNGGEDLGSEWWVVFYFEDHDVYMKINGWYQSYDGVSFYDGWDSCVQVYPDTKIVEWWNPNKPTSLSPQDPQSKISK